MSAMPPQKPGRSKQDYGTPWGLIRAVEYRFGVLMYDLAASDDNHKADMWATEEEDSLVLDWSALPAGLLWLNPPFADITPWAKKCAAEKNRGARILMLVPASVGSNWFAEHVHGQAMVYALAPRLTFEGCAQPYPKDCMLCHYSPIVGPGFSVWRWK